MRVLLRRIAKHILRDYIEEKDRNIDRLYSRVSYLESREEVRIRLPRQTFNHFRSKLQENVVTSSSTELQVASLVGQQRVLDLMERELVHG